MLDFGKAGWLSKAKQQPDKVKMVVDKIKTDGQIATVLVIGRNFDAASLIKLIAAEVSISVTSSKSYIKYRS